MFVVHRCEHASGILANMRLWRSTWAGESDEISRSQGCSPASFAHTCTAAPPAMAGLYSVSVLVVLFAASMQMAMRMPVRKTQRGTQL